MIGANDVAGERFWRNNYIDKIRYYSTFHMAPVNLPYYVEDLARFRPAFLCGFPSAIGELARLVRWRAGPDHSRFEQCSRPVKP